MKSETNERQLALPEKYIRMLQSGPVEVRRKVTPQPGSHGYGYSFTSWDYGSCLHLYRIDNSVKHVYSPWGAIGARFYLPNTVSYRGQKEFKDGADQDIVTLIDLRTEQVAEILYWIGTFKL